MTINVIHFIIIIMILLIFVNISNNKSGFNNIIILGSILLILYNYQE